MKQVWIEHGDLCLIVEDKVHRGRLDDNELFNLQAEINAILRSKIEYRLDNIRSSLESNYKRLTELENRKK